MDRKLESCSKLSAVLKNPCLKSTMEKLFEKRNRTGDIKFMIDGEEIRAHRCVLAALSPRYEAQFYGAMAESDTIHVTDVSPAAFKEFLQFFYTDDVTLTLDNIEDVLNLAKQSLVDELIVECTNFLMNVIGMDKLLWCYRMTIDYGLKSLEEFCVKHIGVNIKSVFQSAEFFSCEREMLSRILILDALDCNETDVFDACISWAQTKCQRNGWDAADTANVRAVLGEALFKIRFCSMKVEEIAIINANYSGLLTEKETIDVFSTIALKGNGAHSSTFGDDNSKARQPLYLEYTLAKGSRIPFSSTDGFTAIQFYTKKAIVLNGFVICNKINDNIEVEMTMEMLAGPKRNRPENTVSLSNDKTKITFDSPIQISDSTYCYIKISSVAFQRYTSGLYGLDLKNETTQNGVSFTITYHTAPILITRLLFNVGD